MLSLQLPDLALQVSLLRLKGPDLLLAPGRCLLPLQDFGLSLLKLRLQGGEPVAKLL